MGVHQIQNTPAFRLGLTGTNEKRSMNRNLMTRKLRRRLQVWQGAALGVGAVLLMGAGVAGVTASSLFVNADATPGDKMVVRVGTDEVFKISRDGTGTNVTIDPGTGGSVTINQATVNGSAGGGLPTGAIAHSTNANDAALLAAGFKRAPVHDITNPNNAATSLTDAPVARSGHTAVWTGTEMLVWGGYGGSGRVNTGGRYNPVTNNWTATDVTGAPSARANHTAVWTGTEMIVFDGEGSGGLQNSGRRYSPGANFWGTATYAYVAP